MKKLISTQWIDNFLSPEDYAEIMELSNTAHYHLPWEYADKYGDSNHPDPIKNFNWRAWRGCKRSDNLVNFLDISDKIGELFDCEVGRLEYFQHPIENFPDYVPNPPQHIDARFDFSGVLYLDHGAEGLGTTVGDQYVEWKPNRLVTFDAHTMHNPHMGGTNRIVLTFFSYKKKF